MSFVVWLCVPIFWQLHWIIPDEIRPTKPIIWYCLYGISLLLGLMTAIYRFSDDRSLTIAFLLAFSGSFLLILLRAWIKPESNIRVISWTLAIIAGVLAILVTSFLWGFSIGGGLDLWLIPLWMLVYFYAIGRRRLRGLKFRANRLMVVYLSFTLALALFIVLSTLLTFFFKLPENTTAFIIGMSMFAFGLSTFVRPRFERFIERHILGIVGVADNILEEFTAKLATSKTISELNTIHLLHILPTLLIREAALLRRDEACIPEIIYQVGGVMDEISAETYTTIQVYEDEYLPPIITPFAETPLAWIRLVLPLVVSGKHVGLWLLGARDPDDLYELEETATFKALAIQTATTLLNLQQSANLHALYQANIERQETERTRLALELHDEVLNEIGILTMQLDPEDTNPQFQAAYERLINKVRQTIHDLRPAMLNYGLRIAFDEFLESVNQREPEDIVTKLNLPATFIRYPAKIEQHIFRIVQQAVENALEHAQPHVLQLSGSLQEGEIQLIVEDDGVGFEMDGQSTLAQLLEQRHYGLVGMLERTDLINGDLQIESEIGKGTIVTLTWIEAEPQHLILRP
ncbi:MAG TPA: hypothetical protein ENJ56_05270 [Anaerolineae bacterium]|nr:hypothetical protein [Anaerolineae bacterium]